MIRPALHQIRTDSTSQLPFEASLQHQNRISYLQRALWLAPCPMPGTFFQTNLWISDPLPFEPLQLPSPELVLPCCWAQDPVPSSHPGRTPATFSSQTGLGPGETRPSRCGNRPSARCHRKLLPRQIDSLSTGRRLCSACTPSLGFGQGGMNKKSTRSRNINKIWSNCPSICYRFLISGGFKGWKKNISPGVFNSFAFTLLSSSSPANEKRIWG